MTQGRNGFSLAHRAALIVAGLAAVIMMTSTSYALDDSVIVTSQGGLLAGTVSTFKANGHKAMNIHPSAVIGGNASISLAGSAVPAMDVLTGINVNPTNGPGVFGASYVLSDLDLLGGPDVMSVWSPGATGNGTAIAGTITFALSGVPIVPFSMPQDVDFALTPFSEGPVGTAVAIGDVFVSNYSGGPEKTGSVIHFPANVGTLLNPFGLIKNPFGATPAQIPALVLQDSVFDPVTNPFGCAAGATTSLLGPVGARLDADNNIWVVNSGFRGAFPSYITEYPPGSFGCTPATNALDPVGIGTLVSGGFLAIDAEGDLWVTDLAQKAVFEFSQKGVVLATIEGNKTGLASPMGIALGPQASPNVYVADEKAGAILEYEDAEDGGLLNIRTAARIQGKKTGINQPVGVAVLP
jgi:hypothetical protein